ncbi:response regulator transcription factor [Flavobacterium sp. ANB]|uniref:LytR/AlgR family response regulator transcription factor n=1 Tax=unclassified Flavobacterium TaxID=196869 RepID=UPI0012B89B4B|nr:MULTISPECIES: response regulator transcription factor [unclassified Flavobacterium]MBF4516748.1 response regulator transcription factor [Flavobacterium sp. ANB]MTD69356.1 response regulator [Flavobacterium sp. LC2016-13]
MINKELIRCIILDDEHPAIRLLASYVADTPGFVLVLKTTEPPEAIKAVLQENADLLFLDIQMPEIRGIEIMELIKETNTKVIITSAYAEYALDGFNNDVIDYLLKPITFDRFLVAAEKAKERIQNNLGNCTGHLMLRTEHRLHKTDLSSIVYIEALGDYLIFLTTAGKIVTLETMKNMETILPPEHFLRIHRSFIINLNSINYLEKGKIVIGKKRLPIGETYKVRVRSLLGY